MSAPQPLVARDLAKSYAMRRVLDGIDVIAPPGRPVGLIGENGVGKSTLLRLLAGVEAPDRGEITRPDEIAYLPQEPQFVAADTVDSVLSDALAALHQAVTRLESLAHRLRDPLVAEEYATTLVWAQDHDAWDGSRRAEMATSRLGLGDLESARPVASLSGGQRSRLALAALVVRRPACVVMDEPTNHLDDDAMELLEAFLLELPGVVVLASHDRVLLDRVCTSVVDLDASHFGVDGRGGNRYSGGFSAYLEHKAAARRRWEEAFVEQRAELAALRRTTRTQPLDIAHDRPARDNDKFLYHFKTGRVQGTVRRRIRNAEQRIAALERREIPKPPPLLTLDVPVGQVESGGVRQAVSVRDLVIPGRLQLDRFEVSAGEQVLVVGGNGSGKSTLLAVLAGRLTPSSGTVSVSPRRALLPQDVRFPDPALSAREVFEQSTSSRRPLQELGLLAPRDLDRPVSELSVGQQRRLALAIVLSGAPDLLLLDEPTNHISLALATELEEALEQSANTVVVASHDRWLRGRWEALVHALP